MKQPEDLPLSGKPVLRPSRYRYPRDTFYGGSMPMGRETPGDHAQRQAAADQRRLERERWKKKKLNKLHKPYRE